MHTDHTQNGPGAAPVCIGDVEPGRVHAISPEKTAREGATHPTAPSFIFLFPFPTFFLYWFLQDGHLPWELFSLGGVEFTGN